MSVTSFRIQQYYVSCDKCGVEDVVVDGKAEYVHSKQQAIKWADMHKVKDGRILCDRCFDLYKKTDKGE